MLLSVFAERLYQSGHTKAQRSQVGCETAGNPADGPMEGPALHQLVEAIWTVFSWMPVLQNGLSVLLGLPKQEWALILQEKPYSHTSTVSGHGSPSCARHSMKPSE